jgi:hypothetical protein
MAPGRQPHATDSLPIPYRSVACRIGMHPVCAESDPAAAPSDVPVIYEACDCSCHSTAGPSALTGAAS